MDCIYLVTLIADISYVMAANSLLVCMCNAVAFSVLSSQTGACPSPSFSGRYVG